MRLLYPALAPWFGCALLWTGAASAQVRAGADWATAGADAQRSFWLRSDPKISVERLRTPGFRLVWKIHASGEPGPAITFNRYIGYRGFRSLAFVSAPGEVVAIDTDLGRKEWTKSLAANQPAGRAQGGCTGGAVQLSLPTTAEFPAAPGGESRGRSGPAKSGVGEAGEGAATIAEIAARQAMLAASGSAPAKAGPRPEHLPMLVYALTPDGMLHSMYVSNGEEPAPPRPFLPPNSNARSLTVIDDTAYVVTSQGCNAPNAVWALKAASKEALHWSAPGSLAGDGAVAFGPDGTIYVSTTNGELVALDSATLQPKGAYRTGAQAFATPPVAFQYKTKTMTAAATTDRRLHFIDADTLRGAGVAAAASGAPATWQDPAGARWIVAPSGNSIAAWKIADNGDEPALQTGWTSRGLGSPSAPIVINGVVFTASNSPSPVVFALDGGTGKELWNSGTTLAAPVRREALSGGNGQLYVATADGTIYAFGFPIEH